MLAVSANHRQTAAAAASRTEGHLPRFCVGFSRASQEFESHTWTLPFVHKHGGLASGGARTFIFLNEGRGRKWSAETIPRHFSNLIHYYWVNSESGKHRKRCDSRRTNERTCLYWIIVHRCKSKHNDVNKYLKAAPSFHCNLSLVIAHLIRTLCIIWHASVCSGQ